MTNKLKRLVNKLNNHDMSDSELIELLSYDTLREKTYNKLIGEVGEHYFYLGDFDYPNYKLTELVPTVYFSFKEEAEEFEEEIKKRIKNAGIERAFPNKYDRKIAQESVMFVKPGITKEANTNKRYNRKRRKKNWEEKPGYGECYLMKDRDKILDIFHQLKSELESNGKFFSPIDKFVK